MPRPPKGELSLTEIRNMVRQHNKLSTIKGVDSKSRSKLLGEISEMGYRVDHSKKKITRVYGSGKKLKKQEIGEGSEGKVKPNIVTKKKIRKKALIAGGGAVPLVGGDEV